MSTHTKWPSIDDFKNARYQANSLGLATVSWRPKIKLHGTNAGVRIDADGTVTAQSRKRDVTPDDDNCGFAAWVASVDWSPLIPRYGFLVVDGEWCGKGIQKGAAICEVERRVFAVFCMRSFDGDDGCTIQTEPFWLEARLFPVLAPEIRVLPWAADAVECDIADPHAFVQRVNADVETVEACDPWVLAEFGVDGVGEGLVYYPTGEHAHMLRLLFKAKGEKHRVKARTKAVRVAEPVPAEALAFVETFVTPARCEQIAFEVNGSNDYSIRLTGDFLKALAADVIKEGSADLEAAGLTWKDVGKMVQRRGSSWYTHEARKVA